MAADVSSGSKEECESNNENLVTMDLLGGGGGSGGGSGGEIEAPVDWEKQLDLMFGRKDNSGSDPTYRPIQDLNLPPPTTPSRSPTSTSFSSSVCTLEKVKYALERAKTTDGSGPSSKRAPATEEDEKGTHGEDAKMMVGVCPRCMQYLLVPVAAPRCPRCGAHVPVPPYMNQQQQHGKKAKIDLNSTASANNF
ncbi:uncharacterized protein M6B38_189965 [Iris pallida]|uniref:Uncharacterized protein n=1 Tax=Iris pallida TaxID=29817 RepID=A0AAX6EID1_IRIPA|nr:uncharacterized protein M6B38_189965 [Iris pallida]